MGPKSDRITIDVLVWRGSIAESRHRIHAAVCDVAGHLEVSTADAQPATSFRSAAKPFQALPLVERGHFDRWGFGDDQLAIMCASHSGSPYHLGLVQSILDRIGLTAEHLTCGYHDPLDETSLALVRAHPELRTGIYNNCSGKHAGLLCLALSEGWPVKGYGLLDHPLEQLMRRTVAEMCGLAPEAVGVAVDGCNLVVFGLPIASMALGYARLASARPDGDAHERALARIRNAMMDHPVAVGGKGRFDTVLMEAAPRHLVSKGGAEGLACVGLVEQGLGLAVKCEDGHARAVGPAVVALLDHLETLTGPESTRLAAERRPIVTNTALAEVGAIEATVRTLEPAR